MSRMQFLRSPQRTVSSHSDPQQFVIGMLVILIVGYICLSIGQYLGEGTYLRARPLLFVSLVLSLPIVVSLMKRPTFENAAVSMFLTLPLTYGFVIDIGGFVRISYLLGLLALYLGLQQSKIKRLWQEPVLRPLWLFVAYALLSVILTFQIDFSRPMENAGIRLSPFRAFIQGGQLVLMLLIFYVTINYINSAERLKKFARVVFWSTTLVTAYGFYEFAAATFNLPFFSVISDTSYYTGGYNDSPTVTIGSVTLVRPRSTLGEPLDLSIFLLFGIPFSVAAVSDNRWWAGRWAQIGIVFAQGILFFIANSRASLLALLVVVPTLLVISRRSIRVSLIVGFVAVYLLFTLVIMPVAGGVGDWREPISYFTERLSTVSTIGANLRGEQNQIGRNYAVPLAVFLEHPILGVGLGNYPFYYARGQSTVTVATTFSLYLRLLTELGIVGTFLFGLFMFGIIRSLFRFLNRSSIGQLRPYALAGIASIVGVMVARVGLDGLYTDAYMWVMWAVAIAIVRVARQSARLEAQTISGRPLPIRS